MTVTHARVNRLSAEKSPYLLQHSHDLVDWYPWCQEAFDSARALDRPVFLSIGYSACHWCHVMGRESFTDPEVARIINEHFIPVKLDREERPDLDNFFIKAVTAIGGSAGWPMTVFLTPGKKPFYGGSYFPAQDRDGIPGLVTVLSSVTTAWKSNRTALVDSADKISELVVSNGTAAIRPRTLGEDVFRKGYEFLLNNFDQVNGGFGIRPKFPATYYIQYLLRYYKRQQELFGLEMSETTLEHMARGGIHDHLGGGFHRYSTDDRWFLPHFEKMLYDQALVSRAYLEAFQVTGNVLFSRTAQETIEFVIEQLAHSGGGFYSSLDADSVDYDMPTRKREGAFYLWSQAEIEGLLERDSELFCYCFGVTAEGNIRNDAAREFTGRNVLYRAHTAAEAAARFNVSLKKAERVIARGTKLLVARRGARPWPAIDTKILCDWNALMISSLCLGYRIFGQARWRKAAEDTAVLILEKMRDDRGRLFHRYRTLEAAVPGMLDDYAFFAAALLDVYETVFAPRYLREAIRTAEMMVELFWDRERKGFYMNAPELIESQFVQKEFYDSSIPSGASIALSVMLRIHAITGDREWSRLSDEMAGMVAGEITVAPYSYINVLTSLMMHAGPMRTVLIAAADAREADNFIRGIRARFLPTTVTLVRPFSAEKLEEAAGVIPFIRERAPLGGTTTAYVCEEGICREPVTDPEKLAEILET